jgi:hypothetical protein
MTILSGVKGNLDLAKLDIAYEQVKYFGNKAAEILSFYRELNGDPDPAAVLAARSVVDLVKRDPAYAAYSDLVGSTPRLLTLYQDAVRNKTLPLGTSEESRQAAALYAQLNFETDAQAIASAKNLTDLISRLGPSGAAYQSFVALDSRYPLVFADYRQRRSKGGLPEGLTPILYSEFLQEQVAKAVPASAVGNGSILTYQSSIQTYGNANPDPHSEQGSIDLWAPGGKVIAGLTTPPGNTTIGVVTNAGGAIRSVVGDDFSINSGKVLSAQGGEILLYSIIGSIDAGKGAKTSITTPPPKRTAILDPVTGAITGYRYSAPSGAAGSGIQTLTSDPDGLGPLVAPKAGDIFLLAPGGTIDAGEAGIRSSGNIVVAAQTVRNADSISASGSSQGVPKVESGSVASTVASTGTSSTSASRAAEESANSAATRAATQTAPVARPTILSVEVLGFGDRNCKEDDKDCFAK